MKVFLVDDEIVIREGIRESFPWDDTPYTLVGEAPDGEMALPIIRDTNPEIFSYVAEKKDKFIFEGEHKRVSVKEKIAEKKPMVGQNNKTAPMKAQER